MEWLLPPPWCIFFLELPGVSIEVRFSRKYVAYSFFKEPNIFQVIKKFMLNKMVANKNRNRLLLILKIKGIFYK